MLFSRAWLADYVELPTAATEFAPRLTFAGFPVERITRWQADAVLDVEITSNRPDCMCHVGLARELAVLLDRPLRLPPSAVAAGGGSAKAVAAVVVEEGERCPRYVARVVRGVRVGESPGWLRERLEAIGLRSVNNVVDVTNYVLWETGQPLHAYDLARLAGGRIVVRQARAGERLTTLDGVERELSGGDLVIADAERPVGLAGVIGGEDSSVSAATVDLLLEGAHFEPRTVRRTARQFALHTDASHRFERGVDPEGCATAVARAAALIVELAGGQLVGEAIDVRSRPTPQRLGRLELARLDRFAGVATPAAEVERILRCLGFVLAPLPPAAGAPAWEVSVPSWRLADFAPRPDGSVYPADFYEEVLRISGLERIPAALPAIPGADAPRTELQRQRDRVRATLVAGGYAEAINFSFLAAEADRSLPTLRPDAAPIRIVNPLSERYAVMRRSLLPNLVESALLNRRRGRSGVRLFEVATVFFPPVREGELPHQPEHLGLVCGGHLGTPWDRELDLDLFDLKGAIASVTEALGRGVRERPAQLPGLLPGIAAELLGAGDEVIGFLGEVADAEGGPLFVAELSLPALTAHGQPRPSDIVLPSRLPSISADFTLTHRLSVPWSEIEAAIIAVAPSELASFRLKVRYAGPEVPAGAVNTTITFLYNVRDRSLTQEEVNARQQTLSRELEQRFGWRG
jgi:phenylalanyl-tRNA synthetase beta chain